MKVFIMALVMCVMAMSCALSIAETYDADVTTSDGTYSESVDVENDEVTSVDIPDEGEETLTGGDMYGGEASGYNAEGDAVEVKMDYDPGEEESEEIESEEDEVESVEEEDNSDEDSE